MRLGLPCAKLVAILEIGNFLRGRGFKVAMRQTYPQAAVQLTRLTITEALTRPTNVLGRSRLYYFAAIGAGLGILFGIAIAATSRIERSPARANVAAQHATAAVSPHY